MKKNPGWEFQTYGPSDPRAFGFKRHNIYGANGREGYRIFVAFWFFQLMYTSRSIR